MSGRPTTKLIISGESSETEFECFDNWLSRSVCKSILEGATYPVLPSVTGVRTVVDVGANCGAASMYFAAQYPEAQVHALEPAGEPYRLLAVNAGRRSNVATYQVGLHENDQRVPLYPGEIDSGTASIFPQGSAPGETVTLRASGDWLRERGIGVIDVLKVDVEGCEMPVLRGMADWLPSVKVLYLEYGGLGTRQEVDRMLAPSHEMALGRIMLTHGEVVYVAKEFADEGVATAIGMRLAESMRAGIG